MCDNLFGSEQSHERRNGVATAVAYIVKSVDYLKATCVCET